MSTNRSDSYSRHRGGVNRIRTSSSTEPLSVPNASNSDLNSGNSNDNANQTRPPAHLSTGVVRYSEILEKIEVFHEV